MTLMARNFSKIKASDFSVAAMYSSRNRNLEKKMGSLIKSEKQKKNLIVSIKQKQNTVHLKWNKIKTLNFHITLIYLSSYEVTGIGLYVQRSSFEFESW